jgi:serpin B
VNATYLKASWLRQFHEYATRREQFHPHGGESKAVPMMRSADLLGHVRTAGYTAVTIPYVGEDLQFVVVVPDEVDGLAAIEAKLTPARLSSFAELRPSLVELHLPGSDSNRRS